MASFLGEIKRRKVFQVAAVYAVVGWLIIQVVDVIGGPLNLPEWFSTVTIVLLAIGFPIAVILAWVVDMTPSGPQIDRGSPHDEASARLSGQRVSFAIQGLVLVAVALLVVDQYFLDKSTPAGNVDIEALAATPDDTRVRRWTVNLGRTTGQGGSGLDGVTVSPNGSRVVYSFNSGGGRQLYSYLDQPDPQPIPRTDSAQQPFFSPSGEWIGFETGRGPRGRLIRASIRGGPPETLTDVFNRIYGASWEDDDSIIFSTTDGVNVDVGFLVRVSETGGWSPEVLTTPEPGTSHLFPHALPGSEAVLFTIRMLPGPASESSIALLDLESGEHRALLPGGYNAKYVPTGHIVFVRDTTLFAAPFDLEAMVITGTEFPVVEGLSVNSQLGWAQYDFSTDGLFVYARGSDVSALGSGSGAALRSLVWVDREGVEEPLPFPPRAFAHIGLSGDDRRLAVTVEDKGNEDIYIYDLAGETSPTRLTFGAGEESAALWMPGDERVVYSSEGDEGGMFWKAADGTGRVVRLTTSPGLHFPETFAPNGQLIYRQMPRLGVTGETATAGESDLHVLTIEDEEVVSEALRQTQFDEAHPTVSPNGRFIAYESNETGSGQVIVRPFPIVEEDERWQISEEVGGEPRWGPFGDELFFVDYDNRTLMVTPVETETSFSYGTPTPLFDSSEYRLSINSPTYAISSDGQRFLMMKREVAASDTTLAVIDNWFEDIRRREASQ